MVANMMSDRRWGWLVGIAVLLGLIAGLAACSKDATPTYRYRLTVEVETPEGLKTGSSVIEVQTARSGKLSIPNLGTIHQRVRGETAMVDLGEGRVLFALLRSSKDANWASNIMFLLTPAVKSPEGRAFESRFAKIFESRDEVVLPLFLPDIGNLKNRPARPMLVTFDDLNEPTSIAEVDPDNLAETFGADVVLKQITVQMTDELMASKIELTLPWLEAMGRERLGILPSGSRFLKDAEPINLVNPNDFNKGWYEPVTLELPQDAA